MLTTSWRHEIKRLCRYAWHNYWGYLLLFAVAGAAFLYFWGCMFFGLGCTKHVNIYTPIDVTRGGQSVTVDFHVKKHGGYQFALLFVKGPWPDEMQRRLKLIGGYHEAGVAIPLSLRLLKDGQVFLERTITAGRFDGGKGFYYQKTHKNTAIREIETLALPPGRYSVVIRTLQDTPAFQGIESFFRVNYYNPKI